ncbi:MAG: hypothetical protein KF862_22425 [Chitinophagaceae bacterium]|nr:hypothetical protein [Chitinophagaceae bacterium]
MKAVLNFVFVCFCSLILFSCQKELSIDTSVTGSNNNNNNNNSDDDNTSIIGEWNLLEIDMDVSSTVETSLSGITQQTVSSYKTTTIHNSGSLAFTATDMQSKNMQYSISTEISLMSYTGGQPDMDEPMKMPFDFTVPATNSSAKYKQIGSDSLYFPDGNFLLMPEAANGMPTEMYSEPGGVKFSIASDTLSFLGSTSQSKTQSQAGFNVLITNKGSIVAKYKRK